MPYTVHLEIEGLEWHASLVNAVTKDCCRRTLRTLFCAARSMTVACCMWPHGCFSCRTFPSCNMHSWPLPANSTAPVSHPCTCTEIPTTQLHRRSGQAARHHAASRVLQTEFLRPQAAGCCHHNLSQAAVTPASTAAGFTSARAAWKSAKDSGRNLTSAAACPVVC